ncbi:MAG: HEAT repeat domain-containing protein [Candidatus Eremiobacterota bacterium]
MKTTDKPLSETIRRLRCEVEPERPVKPTDWEALNAAAGGRLSPEVEALYRDHDGWGRHLTYRLLPARDALDAQEEYADKLPPDGFLLFEDDFMLYYAGIYLDGPLRGKIFILSDETVTWSPTHRSLESFLTHLLEPVGEDVMDDYPLPARAEPEAVQGLLRLAQERPEERVQWLWAAMAMVPRHDARQLIDFLDDPDPEVQEQAAYLLGEAGCADAVAALRQRFPGLEFQPGVQALLSIGRVGTPEAQDALLAHVGKLPPEYTPFLGRALECCGFEITIQDGWAYRNGGDWVRLP